jgi:hypothetical protein
MRPHVRVDRIGTGDTNYNGLYATTITSQDLIDSVSIKLGAGRVTSTTPRIDHLVSNQPHARIRRV